MSQYGGKLKNASRVWFRDEDRTIELMDLESVE